MYTLNFYFSIFANFIDRPDSGNVTLSTCTLGVGEVSITISDIANIGSPTPEVTCNGPGVTVRNGAIVVLCGSHTNGDTIRCTATNPLGSRSFFLTYRQGKCVAAVSSNLTNFVFSKMLHAEALGVCGLFHAYVLVD